MDTLKLNFYQLDFKSRLLKVLILLLHSTTGHSMLERALQVEHQSNLFRPTLASLMEVFIELQLPY